MSPRQAQALAAAASIILALSSASRGARAQEPSKSEEAADYVIGVEDKLNISVWREPELSRSVIVRPDGKITFPLIGDVQAAGKTPHALDEQVTTAVARFIKEPVVTVIVEEINNFRVYVLGEVHTQGQLQLKQRTRLLQALALAGGLSQYADRANLILVREEEGREVRRRVDYRKLVSGEKPEMNYELKPGDTIIVN